MKVLPTVIEAAIQDIEETGKIDLGDLGKNPNRYSVEMARRVAHLIATATIPSRVVPMADGGIGLVYEGFRILCNNEWEDGVELHLEDK